ncbi:hypothetical protein BC938DRAFT_483499 [Jimgerdemannia flammicorona]|uniref:Peptidase M20 dimerisation domain-containing protein n=1 Tax=Jimgerdemannia flammicorona TaxID=994334 RepID=A0A433QBW4_9FUNG|nr:hypothetical protein BC938DRAFT_483499 [Jimgerdemannia flammicorona]
MSIGSIHINVVNIPPTEIASTEVPTLLELTLRVPPYRDCLCQIHADPELGNVEYHSHNLLTSYLAGLSFTVERHTYGIPTGFVTEFVFGTGRRVGREKGRLYDALPVVGHACGHNLIAVSNVAAAVAVKTAPRGVEYRGGSCCLERRLEESNDGKIDLLRKNAFQSRVDACMVVHPTRVFISFDREGSWVWGPACS